MTRSRATKIEALTGKRRTLILRSKLLREKALELSTKASAIDAELERVNDALTREKLAQERRLAQTAVST